VKAREMPKPASLIAAALVLSASGAFAAEPLPPPAGATLLLEAIADGVQIYACETQGQGVAWVFKAPEANLFDQHGRQIGTHFAGPSWRSSDGSAVVGEVIDKVDAPGGKAIPWLLLRAKSHEGTGSFSTVAFVRRAETKGGTAPVGGCDAAHRGIEARMRYSALYQFFTAAK
jgi:hypothetical protein